MKMNYSFIGDTTYSLMLYLLYSSDDMLHNTTFFVGQNLALCSLNNKIVMPLLTIYSNMSLTKYRIQCLRYRKMLRNTCIFAQDHLYFSAPLIDNLHYNVLEDCPNFFTVLNSRIPKEPPFVPSLGANWQNFCLGRIYNRYGGYNPYCLKRVITSNSDKKLFERQNLEYEQVNLNELWIDASERKKLFVKGVFDLNDIEAVCSRQVVIFSQPLMEDAYLSNEEQASIYKPYIEKYGAENILVKLHPRDNFDYKKYFPNIKVIKTKAPQQLLSLMGVKFKIAITVCSSAVSSMDDDCDIIWIGSEIDERIVKAYGHIKCPKIF